MKFEREHLIIIALLLVLPLGLNGIHDEPIYETLLWLIAVSVVPALIYFRMYREDHPGKIGQIAIREELLTHMDIAQILFCQKFTNKKFGEIAVERNFLEEEHLELLLEKQAAW